MAKSAFDEPIGKRNDYSEHGLRKDLVFVFEQDQLKDLVAGAVNRGYNSGHTDMYSKIWMLVKELPDDCLYGKDVFEALINKAAGTTMKTEQQNQRERPWTVQDNRQ